MVWINPYKARIDQYPGKLFTFDDFEQDCAAVAKLLCADKIYCEIGSGSGKHTIGLASREPDAQVFGLEIRYKRAVRTIEKSEVAGLSNLYVLRTKGEGIEQIFPAQSLDGIFVHFPDPWAKERWHKHRILGPTLLDTLPILLKPKGFLQVKTDHHEYFASFMEGLASDDRFFVRHWSDNLYKSEFLSENIPSEFECLFRDKGQPICFARVELKK